MPSRSFLRFCVNYPAEASRCLVDLHSISMTTRSWRSSLLLVCFSRVCVAWSGGMNRGSTTSEKKKGTEGWSAVRHYFLSSHGQLADRFTRPLLAQRTNLASGWWLAIANACVFIYDARLRACTGRWRKSGRYLLDVILNIATISLSRRCRSRLVFQAIKKMILRKKNRRRISRRTFLSNSPWENKCHRNFRYINFVHFSELNDWMIYVLIYLQIYSFLNISLKNKPVKTLLDANFLRCLDV